MNFVIKIVILKLFNKLDVLKIINVKKFWKVVYYIIYNY